MPKISVVVPLLNEEGVIEELIMRVSKSVHKITQDYEIILVDDGSQDATWEKIDEACNLEKRIKGLRFSRNFGHHYAITAGLREALGEWVVVMDGDLQDRPEVIPELYLKAQEGYEIVFVSRQNRPEGFYYKIVQRFFYWTLRLLSGIDFDSTQANFSIINEKVVRAFNLFPENARFYGSTIKWLGFKRTALPATHGNRFSGKPSYTFRKRLNLALDIIIAFSDRPLKFAIGLGGVLSVTTVLAVVWITFAKLSWNFTVSGWTSLIVSIFFFSGVIIFLLGILGIYVGRIFHEVKSRPLYVVKEQKNIKRPQ